MDIVDLYKIPHPIKASVIVPMYNVGRIMKPCLDSLFSQTLTNFEIVFVNDCSADETIDYLRAYLAEQTRCDIQYKLVSHAVNRGVATARNTGLAYAEGEYIYYVDADDYIENDTLLNFYDVATTSNLDVVGCEWYLSFNETERHVPQADVTNGDELFGKMACGVVRWNLWLFFVKRALYKEYDIRFIENMNMGEDMMVMMKLALHTKTVKMLHRPYYHYIQTNTNSLTKNFRRHIDQVTTNVREVANYLKQIKREDMKQYLYQLQLSVKLPLLISANSAHYQFWREWFPESNDYIGDNPCISFRTKTLQYWAKWRLDWLLKLYFWLVIKVVYGIIYK